MLLEVAKLHASEGQRGFQNTLQIAGIDGLSEAAKSASDSAKEAAQHAKNASDSVTAVKDAITKPKKRTIKADSGKTYTVEDA